MDMVGDKKSLGSRGLGRGNIKRESAGASRCRTILMGKETMEGSMWGSDMFGYGDG